MASFGTEASDGAPPRVVVIATDGYVGPGGEAGWAWVAHGEHLHEQDSGRLPPSPSHLAEWAAVSRALGWAESHLHRGDRLLIRTDSALVAKGLASRRPAIGGEAAELRAASRKALARLAERGVRAKVERVGRLENQEADLAARRAATATDPA